MVRVVGIDHLVISVGDFEKSKAFYAPLMEFLDFGVEAEYAGSMMGWANGKTLFWIAAADAMPLLVLPANASVEDALIAARAFRALGGRHLVVTRFDMVRRVGGVLGAAMEGVALVAVSVTPHFAYGLRPLTAEVLARRLLSGALDDTRWQAPAA